MEECWLYRVSTGHHRKEVETGRWTTSNEVPGSLLRKEAVCRNPNEAEKSEDVVRKETMGCATWRSDPKHTGVTWQLPKGRWLNPRDSARRPGLCTVAFSKLPFTGGGKGENNGIVTGKMTPESACLVRMKT